MSKVKDVKRRLGAMLSRLAADPQDSRGWEDLYRTVCPFVIGVLYRPLRGNQALLEEASQEVMMRVARYADLSAEPAQFLSFVRRVCQTVEVDGFRVARRAVTEARVSESILESVSDGRESAEAASISKELLGRVRSELTEDQVALAELILDGNSAGEVAKMLNLKKETVYARTSRLRKRIESILTGWNNVNPS